jgi:O-acetylserine/cysteine efflux transporter
VQPRDVGLALVVVLLWGVNFVVIKLGLRGVSPFVLGGLRMLLTAIPAVFFLPRPRLPLRLYLGFAGCSFLGQFALLFLAIHLGMPSGLAAVVQQSQVPFTVLLAALVFGEHPRPPQVLGIAVAGAGLICLALARGSSFPLAGFVLTVCAAFSWALGNLVSRSLSRYEVNVLSFVVWSALLATVPFFALCVLMEGRETLVSSVRGLGVASWASVAYLAFGATLGGYGLWNRLLRAYPAALVTRFALLVPVVALICGWLVFAERLTAGQLAGCALVIAGVALPLATAWWARLSA